MVSFDFIKNAKIFTDEGEAFQNALSDLRTGKTEKVSGSVAYEYAPKYEIEFGIFYNNEDETFDLKVYYKGNTVVWIGLAKKGDEITKVEDEYSYRSNKALEYLEWFFGKCPDDDTYSTIRRRTARIMFDDNLNEEEFDDRCEFLNVLFNCNI